MKTFYMAIEVAPTLANERYERIKWAMAHCWVIADEQVSAYAKAEFYIGKYDFKINRVSMCPVEARTEDFSGNAIGLEYFSKAQDYGFSIFIAADAVDGKESDVMETLKLSYNFDLHAFLQKQKQLKISGRCLHYEGNNMCKEIINAHSIQKNQSLSMIAENGHVYMAEAKVGSSNKFLVAYKKIGINKASTFLGFCKKHDNGMFEDIDNFPLHPTNKQVFLYAYRSLCREYFVTSNTLDALDSQLQSMSGKEAVITFLTESRKGVSFGFNGEATSRCRRSFGRSTVDYHIFSANTNWLGVPVCMA